MAAAGASWTVLKAVEGVDRVWLQDRGGWISGEGAAMRGTNGARARVLRLPRPTRAPGALSSHLSACQAFTDLPSPRQPSASEQTSPCDETTILPRPICRAVLAAALLIPCGTLTQGPGMQ